VKIAEAGNKGDRVRSDCHVWMELTGSGGLQVTIDSKVKVIFGKSIYKHIVSMNFSKLKMQTLNSPIPALYLL
jgi:citrate lyase gamma subunit